MHIGVITSRTTPHCGGSFTFENELLESLRRMKGDNSHTFTVINRVGRCSTLDDRQLNESKFRPGWSRLRGTLARHFPWFSRAGRRRLRHGYQEHWFDGFLDQIGLDVAWFLSPAPFAVNTPYFTVVWDLQHRLQPYFPEVSSRAEWTTRESLYATTLRRASVVITGTSVGKGEIERFYGVPSERICVLPHPTPGFSLSPPSIDDAAELRSLGLPPGFLFYPAQFWPHKNHVGLLKALRILRDQHNISLTLALAGADHGNQNYVASVAQELGVASQVRFLGFVTRTQLVALYRQALALTYVTCFGPENLPPLEAFALGCPVIASRVPGATEQFGDTACLVDPHDPQSIADAIVRVMRDDDARAALIRKGHERARQFTGDDFVRGVLRRLDDFESIRTCWGRAA